MGKKNPLHNAAGKKILHPADAIRKQAKKRKLEKMKKERQQHFEKKMFGMSPEEIETEIRALKFDQERKKAHKIEVSKVQQDRLTRLEAGYKRLKETIDEKHKKRMAEPKNNLHVDFEELKIHRKSSIFYHPVTNPYGAPPNGQTLMYRHPDGSVQREPPPLPQDAGGSMAAPGHGPSGDFKNPDSEESGSEDSEDAAAEGKAGGDDDDDDDDEDDDEDDDDEPMLPTELPDGLPIVPAASSSSSSSAPLPPGLPPLPPGLPPAGGLPPLPFGLPPPSGSPGLGLPPLPPGLPPGVAGGGGAPFLLGQPPLPPGCPPLPFGQPPLPPGQPPLPPGQPPLPFGHLPLQPGLPPLPPGPPPGVGALPGGGGGACCGGAPAPPPALGLPPGAGAACGAAAAPASQAAFVAELQQAGFQLPPGSAGPPGPPPRPKGPPASAAAAPPAASPASRGSGGGGGGGAAAEATPSSPAAAPPPASPPPAPATGDLPPGAKPPPPPPKRPASAAAAPKQASRAATAFVPTALRTKRPSQVAGGVLQVSSASLSQEKRKHTLFTEAPKVAEKVNLDDAFSDFLKELG